MTTGKNSSPTIQIQESSKASPSREERQVILERAQREVPALRETVKQNLSDLRRIAGTRHG